MPFDGNTVRNLVDQLFTSRWDAVSQRLLQRQIQQWTLIVPQVAELEEELQQLSGPELRNAACRCAIGQKARNRSTRSCPKRLPWCARRAAAH